MLPKARRGADARGAETFGGRHPDVFFEFNALAVSQGSISTIGLRNSKRTKVFTAAGCRRSLHPNESGLRITLGPNRPGRSRARIDVAVAAREYNAGFCDGTIPESQPERFGLYPDWGVSLYGF